MPKNKIKFHQKHIPASHVTIVFIGLILTAIILIQSQFKQNASVSAENNVSSVSTLGPGSSSVSQVCQNGSCVICVSGSCNIECTNNQCTCNGGKCEQINEQEVSIAPKEPGEITPTDLPGLEKDFTQEGIIQENNSSSKSCVNGKCYSCSGSNCNIQCVNDKCTCNGGECQESNDKSANTDPKNDSSQSGQTGKPASGFLQQFIDQLVKFFNDLLKP